MTSKALSRALSALSLELLTVVGGSGIWHSPDQSLDRNRSPVSKPDTGPGSSKAHKDLQNDETGEHIWLGTAKEAFASSFPTVAVAVWENLGRKSRKLS